MRKMLIVLAIVMSFAMAATAFAGSSAPNLTGKWKGKMQIHDKTRGFVADEVVTMVITEQKDLVFYGEKAWTQDGKEVKEAFSGVITPDGDIYLAEEVDGVTIGKHKNGAITFYYLEVGPTRMAIVQEFVKQ
jgi:hypothetical protein